MQDIHVILKAQLYLCIFFHMYGRLGKNILSISEFWWSLLSTLEEKMSCFIDYKFLW